MWDLSFTTFISREWHRWFRLTEDPIWIIKNNNNKFSVNSSFPRCAPSWKRSWILSPRGKLIIWRLVQWSLISDWPLFWLGNLWYPYKRSQVSYEFTRITEKKEKLIFDLYQVKNHALEQFRRKFVFFVQNVTRVDSLFGGISMNFFLSSERKFGKVLQTRFAFHGKHLKASNVMSSMR